MRRLWLLDGLLTLVPINLFIVLLELGPLHGGGMVLRWVPAGSALMLAICAARDAARWRRYAQRMRDPLAVPCRRCGYDLRASRDRCPECGLAVSSDLQPCHQ